MNLSTPPPTMTEERAREALEGIIGEGNFLVCQTRNRYAAWSPGDRHTALDGGFTADQLEAIAWWMRNKEPVL
jgi:hypothetical protein